MREAIAMANRLLFEKVKSNQKNAVGVALVLHSGQEKSAVINKMVLNDLIVLISKFSSKDNILSSVIQSLLADEDMIVALLHTSHNLKNTKNLESYFIEKYDIDINHLTSKTAFANAVKDTVVNLLKNKNDEIVNDEIYVLNQANVIFRIIKFLADNESN
ncbi:MAG: hypothetical protein IPN14_17030 [Bacteroidetes bacterium]|nr:hypothetical protein [Bacteroidota bacterium]